MPTTPAAAPVFQLMVLYDWKPHITPERRQVHVDRILALKTRGVPGLLDLRFGKRLCGTGDSVGWDDGAVMVFRRLQDYVDFGGSAAHDEVAIELVADLERISTHGFEG